MADEQTPKEETVQQNQITLIGFLGADPCMLETRERTVERLLFHPLAGRKVPQDVFIPSRRFARLSLATHEGGTTRWHQLVVWNVDRARDHFSVRIASKGDQVKVLAHEEERRYIDATGTERCVTELVVDRLGFLRKKVRPQLQQS